MRGGAARAGGVSVGDEHGDASGALEKFDAVAGFAALADYAGPHARVSRLQASQVRVDGTMDLTAASEPRLEAEFVAAALEGDPATRPAGEFAVGHSIRVGLTVEAPRDGHRGMARAPRGRATGDERLVEPPACTFAALWRAAIDQGAPDSGTATIVYDADGYLFTIDGGDFIKKFKSDCSPVGAKRGKKK